MVDTAAAERVRFTYTDAGGGERDLDDDLRLACNSADLERTSELLLVRRELGAAEVGLVDRHPRDRYANSPLHDVARRGLVDVAELLLDEGGYDVDVANGMGDRPLHMSAASGHLSMTRTLLQSGAQVDPRTVWGMTPLWWAVSGDSSDDNSAAHFRVAELLLRHGADVSARTTASHTVLMEAARRGHAGMAQLLIDAGTSAHALDGLGETALHKAAASGHAHVARVLLRAGLSADVTNLGGETALDVATRARRGNVVTLLLAMATPPSTNASSSSQPALASGPNYTALGGARPIESDDDELTPALAPSVSTAAASSASSSSSATPSSSCPHGVRHPDKLCGHLEPRAYIEELRSGPATLYANLRRHPQLFDFDAQEGEGEEEEASDAAAGWPLHWFAPGVRAVLSHAAAAEERGRALVAELKSESEGVYSLPLFAPDFAAMLLEEVEHYRASGLPMRRVNSMNRYGVIVNEIGMHAMFSVLQRTVLQPIAAAVYPVEGSAFDKHHSFLVSYKKGGQEIGLDLHTDDSDVTFNCCLGRQFTNSSLTLCGLGGTPTHRQFQQAFQHRLGHCLVHLGRHRHGAEDIASGERHNLVIWNTNSKYRSSRQFRHDQTYRKEVAPPDPRCLSHTHDRDFPRFKRYPTDRTYRSAESRDEARSKAWCPPSAACYDGMESPELLTAMRAQHQEL